MPRELVEVYAAPPTSPDACIFSRVTHSLSADLETRITPCQFGGTPDCGNCGCMASAGLGAIGRHRIAGLVPIDPIFNASIRVGQVVRAARERRRGRRPPATEAAIEPGL
jgi:hypothetical protein